VIAYVPEPIPVPSPPTVDSPRTDPIPVPSPPTVPSPRETEASVPVPTPNPYELAETGPEAGLDWIGAAVLIVVGLAAVIRSKWVTR
jgi:hypothetical protein